MNKKHLDNFQLILEERKLIILKQLDDNILDVEKKQLQEDNLDNSSLENIAKLVDDRIETIKYEYVNDLMSLMFPY